MSNGAKMHRTPQKKTNNTPLPISSLPNAPQPKRRIAETSPESPPNQINSANRNAAVGNMSVYDLKALIEGSMAALLDDKLKNLPTREDLEGITSEMQALQRSNSTLQSQVQQMETRCIMLERKLDFLEKKVNEKNVVVHMPSQIGMDAETRAKEMCLELLGTTDAALVADTRALRSNNNIENVIVKLRKREDVGRILDSAPKIRSSGVFIHKDYTAASREKRRRLLKLKSEIITKNKNIKIELRGQTLKVGDKEFYYDSMNNLRCGGESGMSILQQLIVDSTLLTVTGEGEGEFTYGANTRPSTSGVRTGGAVPKNNF